MACVAHIFDLTAGWPQRVAAREVFERLPAERYSPRPILIDGAARYVVPPAGDVPLFARRGGPSYLAAAGLARYASDEQVAMVHAWGLPSAMAAFHADSAQLRPIVLSWYEPAIDAGQARRLRALTEHRTTAIACDSATVRRRLIEKGVPPDRCVVIRPGVDFGRINRAKRSDLRERLGLSAQHRVLITPEPATRDSGAFVALWTAAMRSFIEADIRIVVPGDSPGRRRVVRLAEQIGFKSVLACPPATLLFEDLVAVADVLVVASEREVATTAIAWSFAASVPVIATAVHATAELVANKVNGLLLKPQPSTRMAAKLAALLDDSATLARVKQSARDQAYEVFSVRRYCDQTARLYDNLLSRRPAADGIADAASVA